MKDVEQAVACFTSVRRRQCRYDQSHGAGQRHDRLLVQLSVLRIKMGRGVKQSMLGEGCGEEKEEGKERRGRGSQPCWPPDETGAAW